RDRAFALGFLERIADHPLHVLQEPRPHVGAALPVAQLAEVLHVGGVERVLGGEAARSQSGSELASDQVNELLVVLFSPSEELLLGQTRQGRHHLPASLAGRIPGDPSWTPVPTRQMASGWGRALWRALVMLRLQRYSAVPALGKIKRETKWHGITRIMLATARYPAPSRGISLLTDQRASCKAAESRTSSR